MPKIVFLGTDLVLFAIALLVGWYAWRIAHNANLRATWEKVVRDPVALSAAIARGYATPLDRFVKRIASRPSARVPDGARF